MWCVTWVAVLYNLLLVHIVVHKEELIKNDFYQSFSDIVEVSPQQPHA